MSGVTQVLKPVYLVEVEFSFVVRGSSGSTSLWNGFVWNQMGLEVGAIRVSESAIATTTLSFVNSQNAFSTIVLSEVTTAAPVKIWKMDRQASSPYAYDDATLVFDGGIAEVTDIGERVTFNCTNMNNISATIPNITINPPYFNFLPRAGQVIQWDGETYELQPR